MPSKRSEKTPSRPITISLHRDVLVIVNWLRDTEGRSRSAVVSDAIRFYARTMFERADAEKKAAE